MILLEAALRDLAHRDPRVRSHAADALGRADAADHPAAIEALSRAAVDPHPSVRYAALLSLGELAASSAVEVVAERLSDGEPLVREAAAIALGQLAAGVDGAVRARAWEALSAALGEGTPEVRFQAVASLAEISPREAAPLLLPVLGDGDAKVRAQAAAALGDRELAGDAPIAHALAAKLDDGSDEVRWEAALALARLGDRRGLGLLLAALERTDRALDAASALCELKAADDAAVREALLRQLKRRLFGDPLVKVKAAEALALAGDARGVEHLERAAQARRDDVRGLAEAAVAALERVR